MKFKIINSFYNDDKLKIYFGFVMYYIFYFYFYFYFF